MLLLLSFKALGFPNDCISIHNCPTFFSDLGWYQGLSHSQFLPFVHFNCPSGFLSSSWVFFKHPPCRQQVIILELLSHYMPNKLEIPCPNWWKSPLNSPISSSTLSFDLFSDQLILNSLLYAHISTDCIPALSPFLWPNIQIHMLIKAVTSRSRLAGVNSRSLGLKRGLHKVLQMQKT